MLALLDGQQASTVAVVELNAVLNAPVGEVLIACAGLEEGGRRETMLAELLGPDPLQKLDRLALVDGQPVLSGHFEEAVPRLEALGAQVVGQHGLSRSMPGLGVVTLWRGELALITPTVEAATALVARLESGRPPAEPLLAAADLTHDVVLSVGAKDLAKATGGASGLDRIELVLDARDDVFAQLRVDSASPEVLAKARATFEATLAATKARPVAQDPLVAGLLESVAVVDHAGGLELTADVPLDLVRARTRACQSFLPRALPEGYTATSSMSVTGWSLAPPPGMVLMSNHKGRLAFDYSASWANLGMLVQLLDSSPSAHIDPRTLQTFDVSRSAVGGICGRVRRMSEILRKEKNTWIDEVTIGGRAWTRTAEEMTPGVRGVSYEYCQDDVLWRASVILMPPAPFEVVQARVEAYLATATLIGAPPPP